MRVESWLKYELFVIVGVVLAAGTLMKLAGVYDISSDWFWFIAGLGLIVEGAISLAKQRKFEGKYKVLSREEYDSLLGNSKT